VTRVRTTCTHANGIEMGEATDDNVEATVIPAELFARINHH
jgi:hypothetical protein